MGCCFSRPEGPCAPYPGGAAGSLARAINLAVFQVSGTEESALESQRESQSQPQPQSPRARRRSKQPLDQHIDKPLRRHNWYSRDRTWTHRELAQERKEFFETRVTGRAEVWQTLHAVFNVLQEPGTFVRVHTPEVDNERREDNIALATAQGILTAAGITLPTGNLANGAYDGLGNYYALPEWIVSDPVNVINDEKGTDGEDAKVKDGDATGGEDTAQVVDQDEALRRRDEKGKGVAKVHNMEKVRARLSEDGRDYLVSIEPDETVRSVSRKICEEARLAFPDHNIKIVYMGNILKENASLQAQGWKQGHVVNAFVFNR